MKKYGIMMAMVMFLMAGCSSNSVRGASAGMGENSHISHSTESLGNNFKVIASGVVGESKGFRLLGIEFSSPSVIEASRQLRNNVDMVGKSAVLYNTVEEYNDKFFLLFSIPTITIISDVVEYTD